MGLFKSNAKPQREIAAVKVLGVRTAEETRALATYNSTMYCLLVAYEDGGRELVEAYAKDMGKYIDYISME